MSDPVKRPYRAPLRAKQAALTRSEVLDAAAAIFSQKGYANTRMEDVAEAAGVAVPTLYKTFRTKSGLLLATIHAVMTESDSAAPLEEQSWWQDQIKAADAGQQLRLIARNARKIYERSGALLEVLRTAAAIDTDVSAVWSQINDERRRRSQMTAESLQAKSALRPGVEVGFARDTLHLLSAPELYTEFMRRQGVMPREYETWLGDLLSNALLR